VSDLPSYTDEKNSNDLNSTINFRRNNQVSNPPDDYYPTTSNDTMHTFVSQSDKDYSQPKVDSYLAPTTQQRTIVGNATDEMVPLIKQTDENSSRITNQSNTPRVDIKGRAPLRPAPPPPTKRDDSGDSYV
jgi:hypothetical protein